VVLGLYPTCLKPVPYVTGLTITASGLDATLTNCRERSFHEPRCMDCLSLLRGYMYNGIFGDQLGAYTVALS
jgi:hypothetical protein